MALRFTRLTSLADIILKIIQTNSKRFFLCSHEPCTQSFDFARLAVDQYDDEYN